MLSSGFPSWPPLAIAIWRLYSLGFSFTLSVHLKQKEDGSLGLTASSHLSAQSWEGAGKDRPWGARSGKNGGPHWQMRSGEPRLVLPFERLDGALQGEEEAIIKLQLQGSGPDNRVIGEKQAELGEAGEATFTLSH